MCCVLFFLQMTNVTPEYVAEIIDKFEVSDENKQRGVMGIEGNFLPFLFLLSCLFSLPQVFPFFPLGLLLVPSRLPSLQLSWQTISLQMAAILFDCLPSTENRPQEQI